MGIKRFFLFILIILGIFTTNVQIASANIYDSLKIGNRICLRLTDGDFAWNYCGVIQEFSRLGNTYHERYFVKINETYYNLDWAIKIWND